MIEVDDARARGRRFAAARVARGLTQRELGKRVGATQSVITQIERGVIVRSKFDPLIMYELGLAVDEETVRFILAARRARHCAPPQAVAEAGAPPVAPPEATPCPAPSAPARARLCGALPVAPIHHRPHHHHRSIDHG